jgi:Ca-activated chloride channel family protein
MAEPVFFYTDSRNKPVGPLTRAELKKLAAKGILKPTTKVIRKGDKVWMPWSQLTSDPKSGLVAAKKGPSTTKRKLGAAFGSSREAATTAAKGTLSAIATLFSGLSKPVFFALVGAIGCLVGAILGEIYLSLFPNPESKPAQVDIMFTLDVTGSMRPELDGVKNGINKFADQLRTNRLDTRIGLIAFGDLKMSEDPQILSFAGSAFTANATHFSQEVGQIKMRRGGDIPESSYDAVALAAGQEFRASAKKIILLITDAGPQKGISLKDTAAKLKEKNIDNLHLVIEGGDEVAYKPLQREANGTIFPLSETAGGRGNFDRVLDGIANEIIAKSKGIVDTSSGRSPVASLFKDAGWFALLAAALALALTLAQNTNLAHARQRRIFVPRDLIISCLIGAAAGMVAAICSLLFGMVSDIQVIGFLGGIIVWGMLGGVIGLAMTYIILNFQPSRALMGGLMGGLAGGVMFNSIRLIGLGEGLGRFIGAILVGTLIGLFIAIVEQLSRKAWVVVEWTPRQKSSINLGNQPVTVGGGHEDNIRLSGIPASSLSLTLDNGQIYCLKTGQDKPAKLKDGSVIKLKKIRLILHMKEIKKEK